MLTVPARRREVGERVDVRDLDVVDDEQVLEGLPPRTMMSLRKSLVPITTPGSDWT
jgi:hypothetical protein